MQIAMKIVEMRIMLRANAPKSITTLASMLIRKDSGLLAKAILRRLSSLGLRQFGGSINQRWCARPISNTRNLSLAFDFRIQFSAEQDNAGGHPHPHHQADGGAQGTVGRVIVGKIRQIPRQE